MAYGRWWMVSEMVDGECRGQWWVLWIYKEFTFFVLIYSLPPSFLLSQPISIRMEEAAAELRKQGYAQAKADLADVNVSFKDKVSAGGVAQPACTLCGDCNTGCNIGAKNTVLMNYLPAAHATGNTEIFCQVEVLYVEQLQQPTARQTAQGSSSKSTGEQVWNVVCASTAPADKGRQFVVTTDVLILAAGTLGSTEILLRSKERGMSMSGEVGLHFGTDGDFFSIGYNAEAPWAGLGFGAGPDSEKRQAKEGNSGPCITSVLDMRDPSTPAAKGMIVEDMAIPRYSL
jgi:cholesterol oxidase